MSKIGEVLTEVLLRMGIAYVAFVVVGFLGGLFCPSESSITGYANDYIGGGFVYSYYHSRDEIQLLLFISIPIVVAAIIISIIFANMDKNEMLD